MRRSIPTAAGCVAILAAAAFAGPARATAGNGIRLGGTDGRLHPYLDYETRYDSNVTYDAGSRALGDMILHIRPGLELKVPGDLAMVEFSGAIDWAQYLGVTNVNTRDYSKLYADAGFAALLNPRGPIAIRIDDDFRRQISSYSLANVAAVIENANVLTLSVPWKPGGGALLLTGRGQWLLESYQPYTGNQDMANFGFNEFRAGLEGQWRFLPRTSAAVDAEYFGRVPKLTGGPNDVSGFDAHAGVTGLVTPRIGVSLKAGYAMSFLPRTETEPSKSIGTFLADVGAEWLPAEGAALRLGYTRAFGVDPSASVFAADGVYASGRMRVMRRAALKASVRYDRLAFEELAGATSAFLRVEPGIEAVVAKWMTASLGYAYTSRDVSGFPAEFGITTYSKNEGWLKLGVTY